MPSVLANAALTAAGLLGLAAALGLFILGFAALCRRKLLPASATLVLFGLACGIVWLWSVSQRASEFQAFAARHDAIERTALASAPLACLANASPAIREGCEEALFANAETIANALSLTTMRLSLLREEVARAETNSNFEPLLAALREPLEADPYGFVAHALEVRFACTAEQCSMFPLLSDHRKVQENLRENAFEKKIAALKAAPAHRSTEPRKEPQTEPETQPGAPHGAAPQASLPSQPKPLPPNFTLPSSDTIPPVSIMDPEPAPAAGSSGRSAGTPAPAPRPQNRGSTREPPMQLVPPTRRP